ncbi:MAG: tetratricopeptide repeat protein, partial [Waterburya sp.]
LFQVIQKQKRFKSKNRLDKSLDKKLLTMLGGDKKAALRLLRNARKNNPGRSYLWYHEKVIRDIERDRRY